MQPNTPPQSQNQPNQPVQQPQPAGLQSDAAQTFIPTKNKPALAAYYLGIAGLIPFAVPLSILAIIFGAIGLRRYETNPTPGAKGHAMAGFVLGIVQLAIFAAFIIIFTII